MAFLLDRWKLFSMWLVARTPWLVMFSSFGGSSVLFRFVFGARFPVQNGLGFIYEECSSFLCEASKLLLIGEVKSVSVELPDSLSVQIWVDWSPLLSHCCSWKRISLWVFKPVIIRLDFHWVHMKLYSSQVSKSPIDHQKRVLRQARTSCELLPLPM